MHTCKTKSLRMKNLFFVAVAIGIFSGTSITAKAQASVNLESLANKTKPKISLHFIESIEITPEKISDNLPAENAIEKNVASKAAATVTDYGAATIELCSPMQFKYAMIWSLVRFRRS